MSLEIKDQYTPWTESEYDTLDPPSQTLKFAVNDLLENRMYTFRIIASNDDEVKNTSESCIAVSGTFCELANSFKCIKNTIALWMIAIVVFVHSYN